MAINKTSAKKLSNNELHANLINAAGGYSNLAKFKGICSKDKQLAECNREVFEILYIEADNRDKVNMVKGKPCHIKASENLDYFNTIAVNRKAKAEKDAEKAAKEAKEATA